ncbi:tRNA pseudouridine(55) synthase TruB [Candidatus Dojkabacteria bacterium]|uniref:tRNA pseudouridine synthase B n=1 Tax=Candidatus Dojkabacteria bacterium TaxID=2099670 RepID=A0A955L2R5_9BACT|nr:tRNA pseudouridine(55) synthase TruB [Candidatus Dojkabacteria bacterium]
MDGFLNINKPKGISSYDVIRNLKPMLNKAKIGHTGTLDPIANGVLIVAIGNATRLIEYIDGTKTYQVELELGKVSDTYDSTGTVTDQELKVNVKDEAIMTAINKFIGDIEQIPPQFSAIKVKGEKAYEIARRGEKVELKSRTVQTYKIDLVSIKLPKISLTIECSKGTYIRSLVHDLGQNLKTGAIMTDLTRISDCGFSIEDSIKLDELTNIEKALIPAIEVFKDYSARVPIELHQRITTGAIIDFDDKQIPKLLNFNASGEYFFATDEKNNIISVNKKVGNNKFHPEKVLL